MSDLEFIETSPTKRIQVSRDERRVLERLAHRLTVSPAGDSALDLGPRQGWVGTVLLPSGRRVVVRPKVEINSVFDLMAMAYRTLSPPPRIGASLAKRAEPSDWLAIQLLAEIEFLLAQGLRRGYVDVQERLSFIRGRILWAQTARASPPTVIAELSDFVADTPENRLIRSVLESLALLRLQKEVRHRLADCLSAFREVRFVRPTARLFDSIALSRLNRHYESTVELCKLYIEGAGVDDSLGELTVPAFFVPMWRIFERALFAALRDATGMRVTSGPEFGSSFVHVAGEPAYAITLKPDVLIGPRTNPRLVVDAKYSNPIRPHHGSAKFKNEHLYQVTTYCKALGCDGYLIYPEHDTPVNVTYDFEGTRVGVRTIDLSTPDAAALLDVASELAASAAATGSSAAA